MINPDFLSTDELYFRDTEYMSVSRYKKLNKCELDGLEDFTTPSPSMLVGSYVDHYVEGTLEEFIENNPEIISSRGPTKGKLKSEFRQADEICEYIDSNKRIQQFLSGEKQTVMTGNINNIPFKIKMDSYSKGIAINDLKVMRSVSNSHGEFIDFITPWGYDIQLACYQEIVFQNTGEKLPCYIVAITKENPINSVIVNIPQHILDSRLYDVQENIEHLYKIWTNEIEPEGCGVCKTCIEQRKNTPIISLDSIIDYGGAI